MNSSQSESNVTPCRCAGVMTEAGNDACQGAMSLIEMKRLLHELQVHQHELEMQNEELRRAESAREEMEALLGTYSELYDSAPVGYFVLDCGGVVRAVNLCGAELLRQERLLLVGQPLDSYISPETRSVFRDFLSRVLVSKTKELCEIDFLKDGGFPVSVRMEAVVTESGNNCRAVVIDITDRKKLDEELRKHAEQHKAILITDLFGFWQVDATGKFQDVNDSYCRMSGYSREEFLRLSIADIEAVESGEDVAWHMQQLLRTGVDRFETKHRAKDGQLFDVEISATVLRSQEQLIAFISDISDRKQTETDLLEKNLFLDALLNAIPVPIFFKDRNGIYMGFNKTYEEFFGKTQKELIGKSVFDIAPKELAEIYHAKDMELISHGGSQVYESKVVDVRGVLHEVVFHKAVLSGYDGEVNGLIGAILDITERNQALDELRLSREKLKAYLDNSFDIIFVLNGEGVFQFVSRAWERHFNIPVKEAFGRQFAAFVHPDDVKPCSEYLAYILSGRKGKTSPPYRVLHADGSWRWFIANGSRYMDTDNEWHFIGVGHDITERMQTENELEQAKAAADAANQAKSDFLAMMSHEIRTPLSALLGNIQLLSESQLAPHQRQYLKDCQAASQVLLQTINDVLDFSKIEAGKLELVNEEFSIVSICRQLVRMFSASAEPKGVLLTLSLKDYLPERIVGDQHRLQQIISNLLSNAIKFTRQGTVSLEVSLDQASTFATPDKVALLISVSDTGIGIPLDKQATIFDSFTQLEAFSTRRHTGTGLGLAICKRLVEMMGGTISVSSVPDAGSVFRLSLTFTTCALPLLGAKAGKKHSKALTPRTILLADDDEPGRATIVTLLQRRGHQVTAVANGAELLEQLQQKKFDIVISDISMPDIEGVEVVRIIRSGERHGIDATVPVIALTAHTFQRDVESFLQAGFSGFAGKPVDFNRLLGRIEELCSNDPR